MTDTTWLCPICAFQRVPYGETCPDGLECERINQMCITAKLSHELRKRKAQEKQKALGISNISDEEKS
jgi:hypothetical protein